MAEVIPFKGYRYNQDLIEKIADVMAPPYDVISPQEQAALYQRHPNNVIRLILGRQRRGDNHHENAHTRARTHLDQWIQNNILIQDAQPNFYLTRLEFKVDDRLVTRYGLLGLVGLRPFSDGVVLPHEHTFSKVKSERLSLMKATNANLCPIFGLYGDQEGQMDALQRSLVSARSADMEWYDDANFRHQLWCVNDPQSLARITAFFNSRKIYIADGHHRYETALNYREWVKSNASNFSAAHPTNYVMMSLCSMHDDGMVILPAHRLVHNVPEVRLLQLSEQAGQFFDIIEFDITQGLVSALPQAQTSLDRNSDGNAIGFMARNPGLLWVLQLKEGVMDKLFGQEIAAPLRDLDVTVLTQLILMKLLGLEQSDLDDEHRIVYCTSAREAAASVADGSVDAAFILNPTRIEQVQRISEFGLTMPRKSTYFFPKVISGQVFNILE